jgi:hypothetical protein
MESNDEPGNKSSLSDEISRFVRTAHDGEKLSPEQEVERHRLVSELVAERIEEPVAWSVVMAMDATDEIDDLELWVVGRDGSIYSGRQVEGTSEYESRQIPLEDVSLRRKGGREEIWAVVAQRKRAEFFEGDNSIPTALLRFKEAEGGDRG